MQKLIRIHALTCSKMICDGCHHFDPYRVFHYFNACTWPSDYGLPPETMHSRPKPLTLRKKDEAAPEKKAIAIVYDIDISNLPIALADNAARGAEQFSEEAIVIHDPYPSWDACSCFEPSGLDPDDPQTPLTTHQYEF